MMRCIARILFRIACGLSLALAVLIAVSWARGGFRYALFHYNHYPSPNDCWAYTLRLSSYGSISVEFDRRHFSPAYRQSLTAVRQRDFDRVFYPPGLSGYLSDPKTTLLMSWPMPGFRAAHYVDTQWVGYRSDFFVFAIHPAIAIAVFLVLPGVWINRVIRTRRARAAGLCPMCGYDLRATPERCPECGRSTEASSAAAHASS